MSEFLDRILATKRNEVAHLREAGQYSQQQVRAQKPRFKSAIAENGALTIVSEVKKASPSKGLIQPNFNPTLIAQQYQRLGAGAISVLTDEKYFQGSLTDLQSVVTSVDIPVLRKDFIIDETQINEAVLAGADAVLLICAALDNSRLNELAQYARGCGLDVLIEVHGLHELEDALVAEPSVLGINNRNLKTFSVDLATTETVMRYVSDSLPVIAESGIATVDDAKRMAQTGVSGLLVGESLMRSAENEEQLQQLFSAFRQPKLETRPARVGSFDR